MTFSGCCSRRLRPARLRREAKAQIAEKDEGEVCEGGTAAAWARSSSLTVPTSGTNGCLWSYLGTAVFPTRTRLAHHSATPRSLAGVNLFWYLTSREQVNHHHDIFRQVYILSHQVVRLNSTYMFIRGPQACQRRHREPGGRGRKCSLRRTGRGRTHACPSLDLLVRAGKGAWRAAPPPTRVA